MVEVKESFGTWLKKRRIELGLTQRELGEKVGVSGEMVRQYEKGSMPGSDKLAAMANALDLTQEELTSIIKGERASDGDREIRLNPEEAGARQLLGAGGVALCIYDVQAAADDGQYVIREEETGRYIADAHELHALYERSPREPFVIEVEGDGMKGTFRPGERIVIEPLNGKGIYTDAVYLIRIDRAVSLKRIQRLPSARVQIISDNEHYPPYEIDLAGDTDFEVVGRAWGRFERL